jgi:hypothetical protein
MTLAALYDLPLGQQFRQKIVRISEKFTGSGQAFGHFPGIIEYHLKPSAEDIGKVTS